MCYTHFVESPLAAFKRYPPDGLLTSGKNKEDVELEPDIIAPDPFASDDCFPERLYLLTKTEEVNTMNTGEDESSSGLNGRLRPRKSLVSSPQTKNLRKSDEKVTLDKPKRTSTPSKASPTKIDDLSIKADSPAQQLLCPYCDKKFASKQTVSKHVRRIHLSTSKQDTFMLCLFCNHTEAEANDIIRHMVDSHPNQYFACLECHTRFPSTSELAEHKLNVCEKHKPSYRSKLRQKSSAGSKKSQKKLNVVRKDDFQTDGPDECGFNGIVISCELKPSQMHDAADIEDNITTNLILPPSKTLGTNAVMEKSAVIVLDDIQWNKRIPSNFSFHNTDADQILSRLGVVHRSPRTGESTRKDWKTIDESTQKFERCFDTVFYSKVASNVQENLAKFLDGSFNFNPDPDNTIKTRKSKNSVVINTAEGFPILLLNEQFSRNVFDGFMPRSIAPKHKWKWDNLENDKSLMNPDQIKRDSHVNNCIITLVSGLDIWTQLSMRRKYEDKFNKSPVAKKTEKKNKISQELKEILESREIPTTSSQVVKYTSQSIPPPAPINDFPACLGLMPAAPAPAPPPAVLSGEWVRPRCYVCCACGAQTRDSKALSAHISSQHQNAQVQHYEIVGEHLLNADILKHLYVPPSQMYNRTRPLRGFRDCTKCKKSITLEDLHQHMLDCAGDTPMVRRKCRHRPFGVRRRRPRLPDNTIRKKIRKDIRTRQRQKSHIRSRPKIRTEVGDAETIRKMIADLPAKRHRATVNPMNPILRPRRNLDKKRNKLLTKRRSFDEQSKRKSCFTKDKIKSSETTSNPDLTDTLANIDDDDNKPLKPKLKRLKTTRQRETLKRKAVLKRAKRRVQTKEQKKSEDNHESDGHIDCVSSIPTENVSLDSTPQRIDVNSGTYNTREHANRGGSNNRNEQQPGSSRQNGNAINPGAAPVQNVPLKHSIASLTANSETHDKSVQFHHLFLVQQECNNVAQPQHLPSGQLRTFENEAAVIRFDKPPLQNRESPVHTSAPRMSKLYQQRKKLNDCITKLRKKVDPTPIPGHVSVQCGSDEPLDPEPVLMRHKSLSPMMDICPELSKSVTIQDRPIEICSPKETIQDLSTGKCSLQETIQDQPIGKYSSKETIQDQPSKNCSPKKTIQDQPVGKRSPMKAIHDQPVEKCYAKKTIQDQSAVKCIPKKSVQDHSIEKNSSKKAIQDQPTEKSCHKKMINDQPIKKSSPKKAIQKQPVAKGNPKSTIPDQLIEKFNPKKVINDQPIKKCSPKKAIQDQPTEKCRAKKIIRDQPIDTRSSKKTPVSLKACKISSPEKSLYSEYNKEINMSNSDALSLKQKMNDVTPKRISTRLRSTAHSERESPQKKVSELSQRKLQDFTLASQNALPMLPVLKSLEMQRLTQMGYHHQFHEILLHQQTMELFRQTQRETSLHKLKQLPIQKLMESPQQKLLPIPSQIEVIPLNYTETHSASVQKSDKLARGRSRRNSYQHTVDVAEWVANMPKVMEASIPSEMPHQKRLITNVDPVSHQQAVDIYFQEDLRKSQHNEHKSCETDLHRRSISEGSTFSDSNLLQHEPDIRNECDNIHKTSDTAYLNRDFNDSSGEIPPAHATTNIESNVPRPLDLTSKVLSVACSETLVQDEHYSFINYETYETLDLSSKKIETFNESSPTDIVVDLRIKTSLPTENQGNHSTINMSRISHNEMDDVTDLSMKGSEDDCLPTDLSLKGKADSIDLSKNNTENDNYEAQDLSSYKNQDSQEQSNILIEIESPTDLSTNEVVDMSIASTISTEIIEKDLQLIENQDGPADLSAKLNTKNISLKNATIDRTQNYPISTWQTLNHGNTNEPMINLETNIPPPDFIDKASDVLHRPVYDSSLIIQQYIPTRITESNVEIISSGPTEAVRDSIIQSPNDIMQSRTQLPCQAGNKDSPIARPLHNTGFVDNSNLQVSNNSPIVSPENLPYVFTRQPLNASISSIPVYTLPNPVMAAPISKYECTTPVYTLANACITVTKIDSSSSATLTNTLLSVPGTTIASTPSVYTLAGTTVAAHINYAAMTNNTRIGQIQSNGVQDMTVIKFKDSSISIETPITDKDINKCNTMNVDAEIKDEQDLETAKKIAMLPKEIVDILGTMPADHRKQLLNVLPQYVSPSTTMSTTRSDTTSESTYSSSSMSCLKSTPDTGLMSETQYKSSLNASIQNYDEHPHFQQSCLQLSQSDTDKEKTHSTNYILQSHPISNTLQVATTLKDETINLTDLQITQKEPNAGKDNFLIDPYTGTLTKRPTKVIEFDQSKIIDLTEDEVTPPNIEQYSQDNSHCTFIPTNEIINNSVAVKNNKIKDKTASLRAVRIKTPSERQKSTSIDNVKTCTEMQPNLNDPEDNEVNKTLDWNKSLAIQQAEVSSTQHSNNNFTVESKYRVTTSPIELESRYQNLHVNSQKAIIPVNEIADISLQPYDTDEKSTKLSVPNNESISKESNIILGVENSISDNETQGIDKTSPLPNLPSSHCSNIVNATLHSLIKNTDQHIFDDTTSHTINTTKDNAILNSPTQIEQHRKKVTRRAKKVEHEEDDSEDDLSLAVIVLQKQRDQQRQSELSTNGNEYQYNALVNQTVTKDDKNPTDTYILRNSEISLPHLKVTEDLPKKDVFERHKSEGNNQNTQNNSITNGDSELIKKETLLGDLCITDVTEQQSSFKKSEYSNIGGKDNIATESTENISTFEHDKSERDESFDLKKTEHLSSKHKDTSYETVEVPEQIKPEEKYGLEIDEKCSAEQEKQDVPIQVETGTQEHIPEKTKNYDSNEFPESHSFENTHETDSHQKITTDKINVNSAVPKESDEVNTDKENKKSKKFLRNKKPKIAESNQPSFETDLQLCSNIEKHVTPLRRSRRGKSMFVDYTIHQEKSLDTETLNTVKPPLTKKQLIFSKLLLDEENNLETAAHSSPKKISMSPRDEICTNDPKFDSAPNVSDTKPNCESDCDKSKTQKRKSWSPARRKSKKKKSLDNSKDVNQTTKKTKNIKNTRKQRKTPESSPKMESPSDHLNMEHGDCKVASKENSEDLEILDESIPQNEPGNENPVEKVTMSPGKRKLSLLTTIDDSDNNLKHKKSKLNNNAVSSDLNTEDADKSDSEEEVETQEEKQSVNSEMHTTCYNMPVAARRTRSKSAATKSSLLKFDPYNIELEDMNEKATKTEKSEDAVEDVARPLTPKLTKTKKKTKKRRKTSTASFSKKQDFGESSGLQKDSKARNKNSKDNVSIMSDSDDSSKSDVPLQKYVDEKEKRNSDHVNYSLDTDDETIEDIESDENDTEHKNDKEIHQTSNNEEITIDNHKEADEQLRSEQFMESFGFFSERKPRKSNLLASKKISETFHNIASESEDVYIGSKERTTKKSQQNERKKSTEVDNNSKAQSLPKKPAKRGRKKKSCTTIVPCYCDICKKEFRRSDNFLRHQMTLLHISKLSEVEMKIKTAPVPHEPNYLIAYKQHLDRFKILTDKLAKRNEDKNRPELKITLPTLEDILADVNKTVREQQLSQRGLSRDEALFLDCCELLKESHKTDSNAKSSFMCSGESSLSALDILEKQINEDRYFDFSSDGDLDAITAKNILESEEVRNLENDLISNLKQANGSSFGLQHINYQSDVSDVIMIPTTDGNNSSVQPPECHDEVIETFETTQGPSTSKVKKPPDVKEKMYPDPEYIDIFEDKFDKIKRKCRSQAAAAKQTQTVVKSSISQKTRRKSEKKKSKKSSKKNHQTQVPTKGALKGFDGIKVSIPTSDINMSAIVPSLESPTKKRKNNGSKKKRNKCSESSSKSNNDHRVKDSSQNKADVYEFMDNEEAELFELRPSTLMERFKSMSNKETPRTSEYDQIAEDADNSSESASDGDDFVYMSDDYVCSDDETESSLLSCETGNGKLGNTIKKNSSSMKKKDTLEKNAVMGKIFKHNAVRSDKKTVAESKETPKTKTNLDQLFDSLLEPNHSVTNNNVSPKKDDFAVPLKCDQTTSKYKQSSSNTYEDSDKQKYSSKLPQNNAGQTTSKKHETTSKKYDSIDYGPSTSKRYIDSPPIDYGPSTSKKHTVTSPKKNDDTVPSKKCEVPSLRAGDNSPAKYNDASFETYDFKEKTSDEGIGTSYDHSAEIFEQSSFDETGVARQRARRKCTVGKQNVLAETWSSESEPDGLPPRPNSAESVVLGATRKKKGRKKEASQSGGRRVNGRQISLKKHDVESRVAIYNRNSSSGGASCSGVGRSRAGGGGAVERAGGRAAGGESGAAGPSGGPAGGSNPGVKPRPRSIAYYNWSSEDNDDQEHLQQHGWIVGDSHKKLVTMLAHAKGRKRNNDDKRHLVE